MLYILAGPDDFSRTEALAEIKKELGDVSMLSSNTSVFDGKKLVPGELAAVAQAMPFLSEKRLIIVEGLLERFSSDVPKSRGKKTTRASTKQNDIESFINIFTNLPESTVAVLIDGEMGKNNLLFDGISPKAKVSSFPQLKGDKLIQWIKKRVIKEDGKISPEAVKLLEKQVGGDLWVMSSEIAKLATYALGRQIEVEDVNRLVGYTRQANIFNMVDAVLGFKAGVGQQMLQQLMQEGMAPPQILFMISRQVRQMIQVKAMLKEKRAQSEMQQKLGLFNEFVWQKTLEQTNMYSFDRLKELYHKLLDTDIAIKTGKYNDELALNILIAEMCSTRTA
ncbi:MAG: DNA polymerase III subunit delta [Dehalococcoidales bacterium]|nr:DNA polymerase III subunit delta [Dehalococcoidales bacterium]